MNPADAALLVVDDNEDNRYTLTRRLKREGYTNLKTANDGKQALELLRGQKFDLMLLDIMMPEMNGYEVLQHLKADADLRHLPVIMISAVGEVESVVRCIELGAEDYLPKPFDATLLRARVGASLEKKALRDEVREWNKKLEERVQEQLAQLNRDLDGESLHTQLVISLDAASRVSEGEEIELYVHAEKMHLFDPATGENLTVQKEKAGTLGQHAIDEESTKTT